MATAGGLVGGGSSFPAMMTGGSVPMSKLGHLPMMT